MNPNYNQSSEQPGLSLPAPYFETGKESDSTKESASRPASSPESLVSPKQPSLTTDSPLKPSVLPNTDDTSASDDSSSNLTTSQLTSSPSKADDLDLIEKEWVTKAKEIVEKTKEDPYIQTKEINQFKADYVKKRYKKDLKLAEE